MSEASRSQANFALYMPYHKDRTRSQYDTNMHSPPINKAISTLSGLPAGKGSIALRISMPVIAWEQSAPLDINVPAKGPLIDHTRPPWPGTAYVGAWWIRGITRWQE